jgi:hypothetical protein
MGKLAISAVCCCIVLALCLIVLAGWQFDLLVLRQLLPNAHQTPPLTALMLLALGAALTVSMMVLKGKLSPQWVWACRGLAGAGILVVIWEGLLYVVNLGPGLEDVLYPQAVVQQGGVFPGRPSPQTIVTVLFMGLSIGLSPTSGQTGRVVMVLGLMGMILQWLALFGYASTTTPLYTHPLDPQAGVSALSAVGFLALGIGVLGLRPDQGLMGLLTTPSPGGQLVRWLLPIALIVPLVAGWLVNYWSTGGVVGLQFCQ